MANSVITLIFMWPNKLEICIRTSYLDVNIAVPNNVPLYNTDNCAFIHYHVAYYVETNIPSCDCY